MSSEDQDYSRVLELISWAFGCLAIASVLWLIKKYIVLMWTAQAVFDRFHDKILQAGAQLYFLCILRDDNPFEKVDKISDSQTTLRALYHRCISHHLARTTTILHHPHRHQYHHQQQLQLQAADTPVPLLIQGPQQEQEYQQKLQKEQQKEVVKETEQEKKKAKGILVNEKTRLTLYDLRRMTRYFQDIDQASERDKYRSISTQFKTQDNQKITQLSDLQTAIKNSYNKELNLDDVKALYKQINGDGDAATGIDAEKFEKCVVKAYRNCQELGNTLLGAKQAANYLDRLLTGIFLPVIIIIYLLVTNIATIKLFILVTSPLLAASFIFGDTCKSIFQGVIFAFVVHLFDVGYICVINGRKMEVKMIGIWKTIFVTVDTNEKIIYQNSMLVDKVIIKQKKSLDDLNDSVEYCIAIACWNRSTFHQVKIQIQKFIKKNSDKYEEHSLGVLVKEVTDKVKFIVHFKHKPGELDMIYSEFHQKQEINRGDLLMEVKKLVDTHMIKKDIL